MNSKVYFIGAGPGDPELLTLKGKKLIDEADLIVYAGSLVNKEIFKSVKKSCRLVDSAYLTLDEIIALLVESSKKGMRVVRVHTGDPSIFGAIQEQMDRLDLVGIDYEIVPGVSSINAAAATLKKELTVPEQSQTVILTRLNGRTKVPDTESLELLASHKSSIAVFLSIHEVDQIQKKLEKVYSNNTPVAVVYKASWPDEKIIKTTLKQLSSNVKEHHINKTALILIGPFLNDIRQSSQLYNKYFTHEYRQGKTQFP